jgi:hypothetical protein
MNDTRDNPLADKSMGNWRRLQPGMMCGCFHCLATFRAETIHEWVDTGKTALCPRCGVDAVLPNVTDAARLQALQRERFGPHANVDRSGGRVP